MLLGLMLAANIFAVAGIRSLIKTAVIDVFIGLNVAFLAIQAFLGVLAAFNGSRRTAKFFVYMSHLPFNMLALFLSILALSLLGATGLTSYLNVARIEMTETYRITLASSVVLLIACISTFFVEVRFPALIHSD